MKEKLSFLHLSILCTFLSTVVWFHGGRPAAPPVGLLTAQCRFYSTEFLDSFECLEFSLGNTFQQDVCTTTTCCEPVFFSLPSDSILCVIFCLLRIFLFGVPRNQRLRIFFFVLLYHRRTAAAARVYFNLAAMTLMQGHRDQCNVTLEEEKIVYEGMGISMGKKKKRFRGVAL